MDNLPKPGKILEKVGAAVTELSKRNPNHELLEHLRKTGAEAYAEFKRRFGKPGFSLDRIHQRYLAALKNALKKTPPASS